MRKEKKAAAIDLFRLIAAVLVICVHTYPLHSYTETGDFLLSRALARVAVPFFFMTAGYFVLGKDSGRAVFRYVRAILLVYLAAIVLYLPLVWYAGHWRGAGLFDIVGDLVFNGTFYHLWYLPAAALGCVIVRLLMRLPKARWTLALVLLLYLIGLLGDSYYGVTQRIWPLKLMYDQLFRVFDYTRNGLFFAPVFIYLGALLRRREKEAGPLTGLFLRVKGHEAALLAACLALMGCEALLLRRGGFLRHDSMYILLLPAMVFLYLALEGKNQGRNRLLSDMALLVYLLHPWAIVMVRLAGWLTGGSLWLIGNSLIHFFAVTALTLAASLILALLRRCIQRPKPDPKGRAWLEIDLPALVRNAHLLQGALPPGNRLLPVVKANAYGHGDIACARTLQRAGYRDMAVAALSEGVKLRRGGAGGEILVMGYTSPADAPLLKRYRLTQTIFSPDYARELAARARGLSVHIKLDTGMGRLGLDHEDFQGQAQICREKGLSVTGIFSHLCSSDSQDEGDRAFTQLQIHRFFQAVERLSGAGYDVGRAHIQGSYGILNHPHLPCGWARPGIALYGTLSDQGDEVSLELPLEPVLSMRARVASVKTIKPGETVSYGRVFRAERETRVAAVTVGYSDGFPRGTRQGRMLVRGAFAPVIGRVCMDQTMLDVTDIPGVRSGDLVTVMGRDGNERITAGELAAQSGTITNEILSRLGERTPRVYIKGE